MQIREASIEDAEEACRILRRSIVELCELDHKGDTDALDLWLANKTPRNVRRWITESHVFVAAEDGAILGVAAIDNSGEITLNYVSPDARFRGVSKALISRLEARALELGARRVTLESTATARGFYLSACYEELGPPTLSFLGKGLCYPMGKQLSQGLGGARQKRRDGLQEGLRPLGVNPVPGALKAGDSGLREQPLDRGFVLGLDVVGEGAGYEQRRSVICGTGWKAR